MTNKINKKQTYIIVDQDDKVFDRCRTKAYSLTSKERLTSRYKNEQKVFRILTKQEYLDLLLQ